MGPAWHPTGAPTRDDHSTFNTVVNGLSKKIRAAAIGLSAVKDLSRVGVKHRSLLGS